MAHRPQPHSSLDGIPNWFATEELAQALQMATAYGNLHRKLKQRTWDVKAFRLIVEVFWKILVVGSEKREYSEIKSLADRIPLDFVRLRIHLSIPQT